MQTFSVAEFIEFLNTAMTTAVFPEGVIIEGEVTEYRVSQGKWIWFLLKDEEATVSCFATVWTLRTPLEDGMQIRLYGKPKVHPRSGKFSVNVDAVELVGEGALRRAFELLKKRLATEGLFAEERKRAIPRFPKRIGLIASGESAAYSDFLRILGDRWGGVEVNHIHAAVQGKDSVPQIEAAFRHFNEHPELADVLVLTRGGGSMEDLQAFNSEEVARAVYGSKMPVVVGVGHERDETLADHAADVRASTPTNAAERVVPDRGEIEALIDASVSRMVGVVESEVRDRVAAVERMAMQLEMHARTEVTTFKGRLRAFALLFAGFAADVSSKQMATAGLTARLATSAGLRMDGMKDDLAAKERILRSLDPKEVLKRGYSVVRGEKGVLKDIAHVDIGDSIDVQLHRGMLTAEVTGKR